MYSGAAAAAGSAPERAMRAAALLLLLGALATPAAVGDAPWDRLDELLPPSLRDALPTVLRFAGDLCELPETRSDPDIEEGELYVVEHYSGRRSRYPAAAAAARLRRLRPARLALYAGGWGNEPGDAAARALVPALLADHALVLELDAARALGGSYAAAAARVPRLARAAAALLLGAAGAGLAPGRVHAVGFSLGAHVLAAAARAARRRGAGRLARLTALDPARPCFARGRAARRWRLARGDAHFVQVLHSSALGLRRPLGHVDVYARPARGGAAALAAAHAAAWRLWARPGLRGRRCASTRDLRDGSCAGRAESVGYTCAPTTRGVFLLQEEDT
ncbi:hepatic triacylglycerol lipase-like [Pectinophora gossypiella]|uniref:hepatic triacylglycerol lipase-like n=1 Tax=Pectinophora gossypiella TaxID=13191 RepID=UPI00214F4B25|nr:hepatic triacylglycerol lipase-like [Pectinophora gossypiella]